MKTTTTLLIALLTVAGLAASCSSSKSAEESDQKTTEKKMEKSDEEADEEMEGEEGGETEPSDEPESEPSSQPGEKGMMARMCPMAVEGTSMKLEDVESGVAMHFTTTGDVAELQKRVQMMAEHHNTHGQMKHGEKGKGEMHAKKGKGEMHGKKGPHGKMHGKKMMGPRGPMKHAEATASTTEKGAKLVLKAEGDQVAAMQKRMHARHDEMGDEACPMHMMWQKPAKADEPKDGEDSEAKEDETSES